MTTGNLDGISVLYVEDDTVTREEVSSFLKRRIQNLVIAADGGEGLIKFRINQPDIVITDIRMPVLDGLKMASAIQSERKETLIIVTTAHSDLSSMLEAIDIGIDHYVMKPVDYAKLGVAISKCAEIVAFRRAEAAYQAEREKLIKDLQDVLAKVKLLSGFLPICSSCKKIRDDKGYWQQIEAYIRDHSEAEFSHGICPDCGKKLYPGYYSDPDSQ